MNEHAAKSAVRSMGCPSVHVPASVLLRDPSGRASHSAPRWMSRYLPQTVLGRAMRGLARSAQRHPTDGLRVSACSKRRGTRCKTLPRPSLQGLDGGHGLRRVRDLGSVARAGLHVSRRGPGRGRGCAEPVTARSRIPQARVRGLAMQVGLLGVQSEQRHSRRLAFRDVGRGEDGAARSRSCAQQNPAGQSARSGHAGGAARGANPEQRRSRRAARFATWAGTRTGGLRGAVAARSRIPQARVRSGHAGGLHGVRIPSSVARAGLHVSRRGPGRR